MRASLPQAVQGWQPTKEMAQKEKGVLSRKELIVEIIITQLAHASFRYEIVLADVVLEEGDLYSNKEDVLTIVTARARMIATRLGCKLVLPPTINQA